jgi:hypothetical protein
MDSSFYRAASPSPDVCGECNSVDVEELMDDPKPIVSMAGEPALHTRADQYNHRLSDLDDAKHDLSEVYAWNHRERFGSGLFASTKPPVPMCGITERTNTLRAELRAEREEIVRLSEGTVQP